MERWWAGGGGGLKVSLWWARRDVFFVPTYCQVCECALHREGVEVVVDEMRQVFSGSRVREDGVGSGVRVSMLKGATGCPKFSRGSGGGDCSTGTHP